jgi:Type II secretion system (T2SS), protein M subtype b
MPQNRGIAELPTGLAGRALALGLPAVLLVAFLLGVVMPLADYWRRLEDEYLRLESTARDSERLIARKDEIAAQIKGLQAELNDAVGYLPQAEPAMAAAQVQGSVAELAERSSAVVRSTQTLPTTAADGFTSIGFQLSVSGSMLAVRDLLYAIEAGRPRLVIDRLTITPSQEADPEGTSGKVDMSLDLHGYMIGEIAP